MTITRIFFATDMHGSEICFFKFLNTARVYKANILILGGDITGKVIIPVIKQPDGIFKADFLGETRLVKTPNEVESLEKWIRDVGYYPYRTDVDEMIELKSNPGKVDALFSRLMCENLERWLRIAEERLSGTGVKLYVTGGNDDHHDIEPILNSSDYAINPDGKVVNLTDHHEMISNGNSNMTPWKCPRDIPEEELAKKIDAMATQVQNMRNCIFNLHCPPYDTLIDYAPKINEEFRPVLTGGKITMIPVGSIAVRNAIEKYQPLVGLHGHIHESRGINVIGRTKCFNPGSEYMESVLRGVVINVDEKGFKSYLLTSG